MDNIQLSNLLIGGESKEFVIAITTDTTAIIATALVGIGSILVSLALVWVTRKNQISQNEIHTLNANLSHIDRSQEEASRYISLAIQIGNLIRNGVTIGSPECISIHSSILYHKSNLIMMLPNKSDETQVVISLLNTCTEMIVDASVPAKDASEYISSLNEQLSTLFRQKRNQLLASKT